MNKLLNQKIISRTDKICVETENIYSDKFYNQLDVVTNALDNIKARRYVDSRCCSNHKALIESGTLGPKGHVQVVVPYLTETYSQQQDPEEEGQIPHCTLKMFPEETVHCIEWARDLFSKYFEIVPRTIQKLYEQYQKDGKQAILQTDYKQIRQVWKALKKRPSEQKM